MVNIAMGELVAKNMENQLLEQARYMEKIKDVKELDKPIAKEISAEWVVKRARASGELPKKLEPGTTYEIGGNFYETDDDGQIYKTNGKLNPNILYRIREFNYKTDQLGRPVSWEGKPAYTPDAGRDVKAQSEAGGKDRQPGDDGGHLVARQLGGSPGNENIVPMRDTVNRGDYEGAENEIAVAAKNGKTVWDSGVIIYKGTSLRPSSIERTYEIDGSKKELVIDNQKGSQELLAKVRGEMPRTDSDYLEQRIKDMEKDNLQVSVTSVLKAYDKNGVLRSISVRFRDESNGEKYSVDFNVGSRA